ncbi:mitochondrial carrier domain-containing protein [Papiliotrema laurentii]|uniref:Mitochondrial glycine transporter n=1 Tax=Papiliotrema laurentii TaxID=5418 RepID=A0AAD9FW42_PAPLA|nr:mitochondrial carrier domain-containing protein [Papiliotrema laurentii]
MASASVPQSERRKGKGVVASHHLSSGALSGFTSAIILQPLDLVKTRLQQSYEGGAKRRKIRTVTRDVIRNDGFFGLWRGAVPTVIRNVPGVAFYFYTLSSIRTELSYIPFFQTVVPVAPASLAASSSSSVSNTDIRSSRTTLVKLSVPGNLVAGAIARTSVGFVLNPITVIKARYESSQFAEYKSVFGAFKSLVQTNGFKGLFQGFTATAARDAPYAGLSLVFYEKAKDMAAKLLKPEWGVPNAALHSGSAAMAATLATLFTSPADCVKTRMQVNPETHPSIRLAVKRIYADRGIAGFFSGSTLRISRKAASGAIGWTVYEGLLLFFRDRV